MFCFHQIIFHLSIFFKLPNQNMVVKHYHSGHLQKQTIRPNFEDCFVIKKTQEVQDSLRSWQAEQHAKH